MKYITAILFFTVLSSITFARENSDTLYYDKFNYHEMNYLHNILYGNRNISYLSFNQIKDATQATVDNHFSIGNYVPINVSDKSNDLSIGILGMKHLGNFSLSGSLKYINSKDYNHRWDNTLMMSRNNPFVIGDSISSTVSTEVFDITMGVAHKLSRHIIWGVSTTYKTGTLSDQSDPRPKTNAMRFTVAPSMLYMLNNKHKIGLTMKYEMFRSDISHTIVDNNVNYIFFLMKGMGDYQSYTSADVSSYARDYKGKNLSLGAQWIYKQGLCENLLDFGYVHTFEEAIDGAQFYSYRGGDYLADSFTLSNRFTVRSSSGMIHNITLTSSLSSDKGLWYIQEKSMDIEHQNRVYYEILDKNKIHTSTRIDGNVNYRLDGMESGRIRWTGQVNLGGYMYDISHTEANVSKQKYNTLSAGTYFSKYWYMNRKVLRVKAGVNYQTGFGNRKFESVREKLLKEYTAPIFEYLTAPSLSLKVNLNYSFPAMMYAIPTWVNVYIKCDTNFYLGKAYYSNIYDGASVSSFDLGIKLTL